MSTPIIQPPHGIDGVRRAFGDIIVEGGRIVSPIGWESANMRKLVSLPGYPHGLYVHRAIVTPLLDALTECVALADGYQVRSLGCFNPRAKRGCPTQLSLHSWGLAVDCNPDANPMGLPLRTDIPAAWVAIWERIGWTWGGRWQRPDPMHFQWASGV